MTVVLVGTIDTEQSLVKLLVPVDFSNWTRRKVLFPSGSSELTAKFLAALVESTARVSHTVMYSSNELPPSILLSMFIRPAQVPAVSKSQSLFDTLIDGEIPSELPNSLLNDKLASLLAASKLKYPPTILLLNKS